jgi:hypothetical protein
MTRADKAKRDTQRESCKNKKGSSRTALNDKIKKVSSRTALSDKN